MFKLIISAIHAWAKQSTWFPVILAYFIACIIHLILNILSIWAPSYHAILTYYIYNTKCIYYLYNENY